MADLIKIKGGKGTVPTLQDKELGYSRDEQALYIGTENGNVKLCGAELFAKIEEIIARLDALAPNEAQTE